MRERVSRVAGESWMHATSNCHGRFVPVLHPRVWKGRSRDQPVEEEARRPSDPEGAATQTRPFIPPFEIGSMKAALGVGCGRR